MTNRVSGRNMEDMEAMMLPNAIRQLRVFSGKKNSPDLSIPATPIRSCNFIIKCVKLNRRSIAV